MWGEEALVCVPVIMIKWEGFFIHSKSDGFNMNRIAQELIREQPVKAKAYFKRWGNRVSETLSASLSAHRTFIFFFNCSTHALESPTACCFQHFYFVRLAKFVISFGKNIYMCMHTFWCVTSLALKKCAFRVTCVSITLSSITFQPQETKNQNKNQRASGTN